MGKKSQLTFEFLIAGIIFFVMIIYIINYLNLNVSNYKNQFYFDKMQKKVIEISEVMTHSNKTGFGLAEEWPVLSMSKIQAFNTSCNTPSGYDELITNLSVYEQTPYGINRAHKIKIIINTTEGTALVDCKPGVIPGNITKAEVQRFAILDNPEKTLLVLRFLIW